MGRPNKDAVYLGRLRDYYARYGALPSYAQLSRALGFRAKNAAFKLAGRLDAAGYLKSGPGGRLVPGQRFFELPRIDDRISAGLGNPSSFSGGIEHHEIDRLLVDVPSATILVQVRGDSMSDVGVLDGDTAIVKRGKTASAGDFVAAVVDGDCVVKELQFEQNRPVLVPRNDQYQPIRPKEELHILGVVTGIFRRYASGSRDSRVGGGRK